MLFILYILTMLFIPIVMIFAGLYERYNPPKRISLILGYRTMFSMKNEETWEYAQKEFGKYCIISGISSLLVSGLIILIILVKDISFDTYPLMYSLMIPQLIIFTFSILYVEVKLHHKFNKDGTLIN